MQQVRLGDTSISTEQIRMIRTRLETKMTGPCTLMVTSPDSMKQKSLISSKLALSFAEQGKKVLLVDCNVRYPKVHEWFQVDNQSGWTTAFHSTLHSPLDFVHETYQKGLSVLTTGPHTQQPSMLWNQNIWVKWGEGFRQNYDLILFEAPSMLAYADAHLVMNHCDGVVMTVRRHQSKNEEAREAKEAIEQTNVPIWGVILQTG
ncbi:CpsD/CapB family tyrosine-protein kinase [Halobacillus locisalis]|uniref:CpsD/CapB family tyrosine-protein kinase n=1 Tax=Halobacillus locisalis TaxID=220753 RepID=A0A838CW20_9BACI|nr:CpsD/CapB family tyrosine-protein kinase [Halobacillus locisalis]MBA2176342.1 CpsD/CapB family tyrosine-protein kinase [Halobacillus locisalis]